jgi:hypothetical protein
MMTIALVLAQSTLRQLKNVHSAVPAVSQLQHSPKRNNTKAIVCFRQNGFFNDALRYGK